MKIAIEKSALSALAYFRQSYYWISIFANYMIRFLMYKMIRAFLTFKVLALKKPSLRCYVDECLHLSKSSAERITHLIQIHEYPTTFNFKIILGTSNSVDRKQRLKEKSVKNNSSKKDKGPDSVSMDIDINELANGMEKLMVPRNIRFKHGKSSTLTYRQIMEQRSVF